MSGSACASRFTKTKPPKHSARTGPRVTSSGRSVKSARSGTCTRRPSSAYVHPWYGHRMQASSRAPAPLGELRPAVPARVVERPDRADRRLVRSTRFRRRSCTRRTRRGRRVPPRGTRPATPATTASRTRGPRTRRSCSARCGRTPSARTRMCSSSVMPESMVVAGFNLADLFERVADAVPERVALVAGDDRRTYRELDDRATRLAHETSSRPHRPVPLELDRARRADARVLQARCGPDQRELALHAGRDRVLLPPTPTSCSAGTTPTTTKRSSRVAHRRVTSGNVRATTITCSTRAAPPACRRASSGATKTSSSAPSAAGIPAGPDHRSRADRGVGRRQSGPTAARVPPAR